MFKDVQYIRQVLQGALELFQDMPVGWAWNGDITGKLDPEARKMIISSLEGKIKALDQWLSRPWSDMEELTIMELVEEWAAQEILIRRMGQKGIPDLNIPIREVIK